MIESNVRKKGNRKRRIIKKQKVRFIEAYYKLEKHMNWKKRKWSVKSSP